MDDRGKHVLEGVAVLAAALTVGLLGAGEAGGADQAVSAGPGNVFAPRDVTVGVGEAVTWTNVSGSHNVRFDDGSYEEPAEPDSSAWTRSRTFTSVGTFGYYCELHRSSGMTGTVTVVQTSTPAPPPPGGAPPTAPPPGAPPLARAPLKVTLRLSDSKPRPGERVRFYGVVRPQYDGRSLQIQRRTRSGAYRTVATTRIRDAGKAKSSFSRRLRILGDGVFRARVSGDRTHAAGVSAAKRVQVA